MSNGTSTSIGVRAAHGDTANAACSSARLSASSPRRDRPRRAGRRGRTAARRGRTAAPSREMRCPARHAGRARLGRRRRSRRATASGSRPSSTSVLTDSCSGQRRRGRCGATRSRSASSASTSAAQSVGAVGRSRRALPTSPASHQRCARGPRHSRRAAAGSAGQTASIVLSRNGFGSPSAGAGAQCSTTPHGLAGGSADRVDDVLELAEEIRRSARLGLGGAPVVTGQQQRVLGAGERHIQQPALLVDAALLEAALVLGDLVRQALSDR